jgi:hypothetical protein
MGVVSSGTAIRRPNSRVTTTHCVYSTTGLQEESTMQLSEYEYIKPSGDQASHVIITQLQSTRRRHRHHTTQPNMWTR